MNNTVYMLGAGLNRAIRDGDGLSPPLLDDFFQVVLNKKEYHTDQYNKFLQPLYDYIQKYWGKDKHSLASIPFDIEECFTLLELQSLHEQREENIQRANELVKIQSTLTSLFADVISRFETYLSMSPMRSFGEFLYEERPCVLTFNYDCFVETIIESASGLSPDPPGNVVESLGGLSSSISDDLIAYSHFRWNRPRGYGFKFDFIELHQAIPDQIVEGKRFYSHPKNGLYSWPILKLHGSLNWFRNLAFRLWEPKQGAPSSGKIKEEIVLQKTLSRILEPTIARDSPALTRIMITPTIHKDDLIHSHPAYERIFDPLWKKAREALSSCTKLVVIGYSFLPTDFQTKRLLLESFSDHSLEELIVVNPDTSVCRRIEERCHFNKPVILCANLDEFLSITRECA